MTSSTDLAALLCSRLCHDLMSPVGALGNGLELLGSEEDPQMREHCLGLINRSAQASTAKLRFFRLAFGSAGSFDEDVPTQEAYQVLTGLTGQDGKVSLEWAVEAESMPKNALKVLLNLAGIGLDALVRGGTLAVGAELGEEATEIVVRAAGPRIAFSQDISAALDGSLGEHERSARTAPAVLVRLLAEEQGGEVQFALADDALIMGAVLPDA
jgi:histidine phosphotransferase ChpT